MTKSRIQRGLACSRYMGFQLPHRLGFISPAQSKTQLMHGRKIENESGHIIENYDQNVDSATHCQLPEISATRPL
jgi:hypothetical protein